MLGFILIWGTERNEGFLKTNSHFRYVLEPNPRHRK
jgi:hypothetical protein